MRRLAPLWLVLVAGCFTPPQPAVLFSCDPERAAECPEGYACESDGCCHKDGSDVEAALGGCRLAPGTGTTLVTETTTETSTTTSTTTATTTATTTQDTGASSETGSGSSSTT